MAYKQISPQVVTEGGTGVQSATAYAVLCGGTTATGAFQSIAGVGTSGQVLTSNDAGALPTFQSLPASGDVSGPGSSTDRAIATWNGTGGDTLFNNSTITISSDGEMINSAQSAFLGTLNSNVLNVTGNGAIFTLGSGTALTEVFDQNGDFVTSGTFTAPVSGKYLFTMKAWFIGCTVANRFQCSVSTSNRVYYTDHTRPASAAEATEAIAVFAEMDAADTATSTAVSYGEAGNTDDIQGTGGATFFSGVLIC